MNHTMTVGIVLSAFRGCAYLRTQLDSLRAQTRPADLVVIADDDSGDGTADFLESYIREYELGDKWKFFQNECRLGYVKSFYRAMDNCPTDLIFLCDQDDVWAADKLEKMQAVLQENEKIALLCSAHSMIDARGNQFRSIRYRNFSGSEKITSVDARSIILRFSYPGMCMCVRRAFWNRIRETAKRIDAPHDRVLALMAEAEQGMYFYDYIGAHHRMHGNNAGQEENRPSAFLRRDVKIRELTQMTAWLSSIARYPTVLSPEAGRVIGRYNRTLMMRVSGLTRKNVYPLCQAALRFRGYVSLKAFLADLYIILFAGNANPSP
jgi:glycosyltransferase involved in cell wall biosynthesis